MIVLECLSSYLEPSIEHFRHLHMWREFAQKGNTHGLSEIMVIITDKYIAVEALQDSEAYALIPFTI